MNLTLDGYHSGPTCELDWHFERWSPEMGKVMTEQLSTADTILLGRITYQAMAAYWPSVIINMSYPLENIAFARMMNEYRKIVFSTTLKKPSWNNSTLIRKNVADEVTLLKKQCGRNLILYGSGKLASTLIAKNLVDEYVLWLHPVVLGEGKRLFSLLATQMSLNLINTRTFHNGVVLLHYRSFENS